MTTMRPYGPLRLAVIAVGIVLAMAWGGVALFLPSQAGPSPAPGTPLQISAAKAMLQTLPSVPGATRDPYDTACRQPRTWCLTSTTLTHQQLTAEALELLKATGASVSSHSCAESRTVGPMCSATLHYRGTRLTLSSDAFDVALALAHRTDAATTLAVSVDENSSVGVVLAPLGTWASIDPLPATWPLDPPCVTRTSQGCASYELTGAAAKAFPGTLEAVAAAAVASLSAHGFATEETCVMTQHPVGPHCILMAEKFRSPGGGNGISGTVSVRQLTATTVTVSIYFVAVAS